MEKLLSAAEAKAMTEQSIDNLTSQKMVEINSEIRTAIDKGEFSISGDGTLTTTIIEKLRNMGYKVKNDSQYNESFWSISWR